MEEVVSYVKNHNLGFKIPYSFDGEERNYQPDFIVRIRMTPSPSSHSVKGGETKETSQNIPSPLAGEGKGEGDLNNILNLIIEVTGEKKKDKEVKVATAKDLWIPAVNNHNGFGKWAFIEITDPWNAINTIKEFLQKL